MSKTNWGGPYCIAALFCDVIGQRTEHGTRDIYTIHNHRRITRENDETTIQLYLSFIAGTFSGKTSLKVIMRFMGHSMPILDEAYAFIAGPEIVDERREFTLKMVPGIYWFDVYLGHRFMTTTPLTISLHEPA